MKAARGRRHPGDRRHGPRARRLQRRQAGLRRRARATRRPTSSGPPTCARRCATSSPARRSTTACSARRENSVVVDEPIAEEVKRQFAAQRRALPVASRDRRAGARARHAAAAAESGARRQAGDPHRARRPASRCRRGRACSSRRSTGVGRDYPALDREALPGPLLLRRQGLARGLRALQADPALRRDGPHDVDPLAATSRSSSSSA